MLRIIFLTAFLALVSQAYSEETPEANTSKFSLAALLPLSGGASDQGKWAQQGFQIALELLPREMRERVELVYEDSRGDTKEGLSGYRKLALTQKPLAIFTWGSNVGVGLIPVMNREHVVQIGIATGSPTFRTRDDFNFRVFHGSLDEAKFLASQIHTKFGNIGIAMLAINNEYGATFAQGLREALGLEGQRILFDELFNPGTGDFRAQLSKLKAQQPGLFLIVSYPTEGANILKQAKELGISVPVLASGALASGASLFDLLGDGGEGLFISVLKSPLTRHSLALNTAYKKRFGQDIAPVNWYTPRAYDALNITIDTLRACSPPSSSCLKEGLARLPAYEGASGIIDFDEYGDISSEFEFARIKGKEFVRVPF